MEVFLQENIPPHHGATPARSVNRHDLQRALEEADGSMKPWGNHGVSPSGWYPLVMTFTVRHGQAMALIEIDGLPTNSMVIFHGYVE